MRPPNQFGDALAEDADSNGENAEGPNPEMLSMMICTKLAGRAVIRVVGRCNDAQDDRRLDLSKCQLVQVPDAVYHLLRHTELETCDLSGNVITKIPPKFAINFKTITELNLSQNQLAKLPDEMLNVDRLHSLNISHNTFITLPDCIFNMRNLRKLIAHHNFVIEVEVENVEAAPALESLDLSDNPLSAQSYDHLLSIRKFHVILSPRVKEDWEDLTI